MAATAASRGGSGASCVWKPIVSPPVARGEVVSRGGAGRDGAGAGRGRGGGGGVPGGRSWRSGNASGSGSFQGEQAKENLRGRRLHVGYK